MLWGRDHLTLEQATPQQAKGKANSPGAHPLPSIPAIASLPRVGSALLCFPDTGAGLAQHSSSGSRPDQGLLFVLWW